MNTIKKLFSGLWFIITVLLIASLVLGFLSLQDVVTSIDYDSATFMVWFGAIGLIVSFFLAKYLDVPGR